MPGTRRRASSNRLYRQNLAKGQTGLSIAFDLPTQTGYDSDHILARGEVGKVGVAISHIGDMRALFDEIPLASMNTSMTINATAPWLMALYIAVADEQGANARRASGHDPERHHQGISGARVLCLPAGRLAEADQGPDPVLRPRGAEVEPDERLLLPSAGGGGDAGAGAFLRARHRHRRARAGSPIGRGRREELRQRGRQHVVLRQRRHALCHRTRQDARFRRAVGRDHPRPVRRAGRVQTPFPLRRAGQLARPHRAAAGEQRLSHPDRDAVGGAVEERARPRRPAAGLERGARPAAPLRPAMVAAPAADHGLRDGPSGVRRHLRRQPGSRGAGRGDSRRRRWPRSPPSTRWAGRSRRSRPGR